MSENLAMVVCHGALACILAYPTIAFFQGEIQNLGIWEVDLGILGNIRYLAWMCFRASKTQELKGPAFFFFSYLLVLPLKEFAYAHSLPSVAQVNCF